MNAWIYLFLAGLFEIGFTTFMRLSDGFRRWEYTVAFGVCAIASFGLLTLAARTISLGISYAAWTGMGAAGTMIVSVLFFQDKITSLQIFFVTLIVLSVIGLKWSH